MTTTKTKVGNIDVERVSTTQFQVMAAHLRVNGQDCVLDPTIVRLHASGWGIGLASTLQRCDGRRLSHRGLQKVHDVLVETIGAHIDDLVAVEAERWELVTRQCKSTVKILEVRLREEREAQRTAECQLRAHQIQGSAGEGARVLAREGYAGTPEDLEAMVRLLTE